LPNSLAIPGPDSKYQTPGANPAGFLAGLWHGLICPITLIVSFFSSDVRVYELNNGGRFYDLGFVLGASLAFGSSGVSFALRVD
jgi:hypothetical protein